MMTRGIRVPVGHRKVLAHEGTPGLPSSALACIRGGNLRPLCVFDDERMPYKEKVTKDMSWNDIPTCKESGVPTDYLMLRGIFMPPGVSPDQVGYYLGLLAKLRALPEWKAFMDKGAFKQSSLTGAEFFDWLGKNEQLHRSLMKESGFIAN